MTSPWDRLQVPGQQSSAQRSAPPFPVYDIPQIHGSNAVAAPKPSVPAFPTMSAPQVAARTLHLVPPLGSSTVSPAAKKPVERLPVPGIAVTTFAAAFFVPLLAVILGHIAWAEGKRRPIGGKRLIAGGLVLGYFGVLWTSFIIASGIGYVLLVQAGGSVTFG